MSLGTVVDTAGSYERTRIIYICGHPRSGTTLIARLLGGLEGCVWIGDVHSLWRLD